MSESPLSPATFRWSSVRGLVLKAIVGSVIFAAAIAIFAIIVGSFGVIEGKLLTIVLLFIFFALGCLFDAAVVSPKNELFAFVGIFVNVYLLLVGVYKIAFAGLVPDGIDISGTGLSVFNAFWVWVWLVIIARLAVGYAILVVNERKVYRYNALEPLITGTVGALALLTLLISLPSILTMVSFPGYFWRLTAVVAVLTVLGTVLIPLVGRFFGERIAPAPQLNGDGSVKAQRLAWPRLEDGTPLPALPGSGAPDYSVVRPPESAAGDNPARVS
jgi:hypothetical protein